MDTSLFARLPDEGVAVEVTDDGGYDEICFRATIYSSTYEEANHKPKRWEDIDVCCSQQYIPGQENERWLGDNLVDLVDVLFDKGVVVREITVTGSELYIYLALPRQQNPCLYEWSMVDLWTQTIEAIGTTARPRQLRTILGHPNHREGMYVISYH
jgi:hypothetical protein